MSTRLTAAVLALALIGAACTAASPTPQPTGQTTNPPGATGDPTPTAEPTNTSQPTATAQPGSPEPVDPDDPFSALTDADINPPRVPLPEPLLATPEEIVEAMFVPGQEELVIVSMLDQLEIGLYRADGTPIRTGSETSDADFYMFEDEAYGLVALLRAQYNDEWMDFRDFHAALAEFGLEGTPEELVQAYADAYTEAPNEPMSMFVQAQAFLDVEAQIAPLGIWLLFFDGLVPPNGSAAIASIGGVAAPPRGRNGVAYQKVRQLRGQAAANAVGEARILAMSANLTVEVQPTTVHEGHRGPGESASVTATVRHFANASPFSGLLSLQFCNGGLAGIPMLWSRSTGLTNHGTVTYPSGFATDARGVSSMMFQAKAEAANGRGHIVREVASITVSASKSDLIQALCGQQVAARLGGLSRGALTDQKNLVVAWHEPDVMLISLTNEYHIQFGSQLGGTAKTEGTDTFNGVLVEQEDGFWFGTVWATADGGGNGVFATRPGCAASWDAYQLLHVGGTRGPSLLPGHDPDPRVPLQGDFTFEFLPAAPPGGNLGDRRCSVVLRRDTFGNAYAPFNDARVWDSNVGVAAKLPPRPGKTTTPYPIPGTPNVQTTIGSKKTTWTVTIEFPPPPP